MKIFITVIFIVLFTGILQNLYYPNPIKQCFDLGDNYDTETRYNEVFGCRFKQGSYWITETTFLKIQELNDETEYNTKID